MPPIDPVAELVLRALDSPDARWALVRDDEPGPEEAHPVVIAVDALRATSPAQRRDRLAALWERVAPGGVLALAEGNALGAKYLAGSPDDETGRPFDSVEAYPTGAEHPALTPDELGGLVAGTGLAAQTLLTLPDHRAPRALVRDLPPHPELRALPSLLAVLPSPDRSGPRPRLVDERRLWTGLTAAGVAPTFANGWVVLLSTDDSALPPGLAAVFVHRGRAARYVGETRVVVASDGPRVRRRYPDAEPDAPYLVVDSDEPFVVGTPFIDEFVSGDPASWPALLREWQASVASLGDPLWLDSHPGNFVRAVGGELRPIDREFATGPGSADFFLRRSVWSTARLLAERRAPQTFPAGVRRRDALATHLGVSLGLPDDGSWILPTLKEEAVFQSEVAGDPGRVSAELQILREQARTELGGAALGERTWETLERTIAERDKSHILAGRQDARIRELERRVPEFEKRVADLVEEVRRLEHAAGEFESEVRRRDARLATAARKDRATKAHLVALEDAMVLARRAIAHAEADAERATAERDALHAVLASRAHRGADRLRGAMQQALPSGSRRRRLVAIILSRGRRGS
jgi:hypothetical protein